MSNRKKPPALTLDFVTALSLSECGERLKKLEAHPDKTVTPGRSPGGYTISRRARFGLFLRLSTLAGYYTVSQQVTLHPVERGTHVRESLHPGTRLRLRLEKWGGYWAAGGWILLFAALFPGIRFEPFFLVFIGQGVLLWDIFRRRRKSIMKRAQELSRQIRAALYIPPTDPSQPV